MKKRNNKGFVLAEAIISAVFVLGVFTFLIMNIFPLTSKYEKTLNYDNPEDLYFINTLLDIFENEISEEENLYSVISNKIDPNNYILKEETLNFSFCNKICDEIIKKDFMNISNILFIKIYNSSYQTSNGSNDKLLRGFTEYLKYFKNQIGDGKYGVAMIIRFDNGHYASTFIEGVS